MAVAKQNDRDLTTAKFTIGGLIGIWKTLARVKFTVSIGLAKVDIGKARIGVILGN